MTRPGGVRKQFEDFFAGELALRRAYKHLAQTLDPELSQTRRAGITHGEMLIAELHFEIQQERRAAIRKRAPK